LKGSRFLHPDTITKISQLNLIARLVVEGFISGLHRSPYKGFSVEFSEHKEYSPGDDLKHLDWKVYGKTDRYYVKQYQEETNLKAYLLLDASGSMGFSSPLDKEWRIGQSISNSASKGRGPEANKISKLEYACYLTACLAYLMTKQKDAVGLLTFDEKIRKYLPPKGGPRHLQYILQELDDLKPGHKTNISEVFHDLAETIKRRGLIIVLSDLFDNPEEIIKALNHFRNKKHEVLVFHILDKNEITFPYHKVAEFKDMETGERVVVDPSALRDYYWAKMDDYLYRFKKECKEKEIDYVKTETSTPLDSFLFSYLSKRAKLG